MPRYLCTIPPTNTMYDGTIYILAVGCHRSQVEDMIDDDLEAWLDHHGIVIADDFECKNVTVEYMDDEDDPYPEYGFYEIDHVPATTKEGEAVVPYPKKFVHILDRNGVHDLPFALYGTTVTTPPAAAKPTTTPAATKTAPTNPTIGKQDTSAMKLDALKNMMFREVSNVVLDGMTGKPAIKTDTGLVSITFGKPDAVYAEDGASTKSATRKAAYELSVNPITDMGMELPAIAMAVPLNRVDIGDIYIAGNGSASFVTEVENSGDKFRIVSTSGTNSTITPATNVMFGTKTVLVIKNMTGALSGNGTMNPLMMMMMMMKDGTGDSRDMLRTMMLAQMLGGQNGTMNPLAMAAFL